MKNHLKFIQIPAVLFLLFQIALPSISLAWTGKVVSVADGDTITVMRDGKGVRIRLYGIDTPEKGQAFGQKATEVAKSMVAGRKVFVDSTEGGPEGWGGRAFVTFLFPK